MFPKQINKTSAARAARVTHILDTLDQPNLPEATAIPLRTELNQIMSGLEDDGTGLRLDGYVHDPHHSTLHLLWDVTLRHPTCASHARANLRWHRISQ